MPTEGLTLTPLFLFAVSQVQSLMDTAVALFTLSDFTQQIRIYVLCIKDQTFVSRVSHPFLNIFLSPFRAKKTLNGSRRSCWRKKT